MWKRWEHEELCRKKVGIYTSKDLIKKIEITQKAAICIDLDQMNLTDSSMSGCVNWIWSKRVQALKHGPRNGPSSSQKWKDGTKQGGHPTAKWRRAERPSMRSLVYRRRYANAQKAGFHALYTPQQQQQPRLHHAENYGQSKVKGPSQLRWGEL